MSLFEFYNNQYVITNPKLINVRMVTKQLNVNKIDIDSLFP